MYIGNTPFQGLVGGGNILDASIEGVDLSTSAIAARLGYTPVDPGAAAFTATLTAKDIQQDNATYIKGKLAAGTATRLFGINSSNTLYIGSVDADHTGGTLFVKNGATQMTLDASSALTVVGDLINNGGRLSLYRSAGASYIDWASGQSLNFRTETSAGGAGASTLMTVDATGRLGVGTQSPAYLIHAVGAGEDKAEIQAQNTSTASNARGNLRVKSATSTYGGGVMMTNGTDIAYPTSALCLYNYDNQPVIFGTNNAERARIDATGKVGINDTNPTTLLSIAGGTAATLGISITPSGWNNAKHRFHVPTSGDTSVWSFNYSGSAVDFASYGTSSVSVASGTVYIGIGGANTAPSTKATFNSTGLGVGMTPSVALDVYSAGSGIIRVRGGTGNNEGSAFYVTKAANTGTLCAFGDWARIGGGTPDQVTALWTADTPLMFHVYNAERMRIDIAGRLGIGTTSPTNGYKITIASSDNSSRIIQYQATTQADINPYVVGGIDLADVPRDGVSSNPAAYMRFINRNTNSSFATAIRGLDIAFGTVDGNSGQGASATERMRILHNGYVGMGTATPAVELEVRGRTRVGDGATTITMGYWDSFSNRIESVSKPLFLTSYSDSIRFGMSGSENMRIDSSGNLLVGTTTTSMSYDPRLAINGSNAWNGLARFENSANSGDVNHGTINIINTATGATGNDARIMFSFRQVGATSGLDPMASIGAVKEAGENAAAIQFNTRSAASVYSEKARITASGTLVARNPAIFGRGMTGEDGYAIEAPFAVSLPVYTYYNGSGYSNYAARLCKLTPNGGDARFVATIYSRGDYNYSYMAAETHIDIAKWSNSLGSYEFFGKEVLGSENIRFAMDANGYIWYHFGSLWTQDHVMVIHRMQNTELAITNTTYHNSTLVWKTVPAGGAYNEENSWGS